ncbi:MAG: hypothetical protein GY832_03895 [Chloroflexi bacterium]|nr:hypothetical protein [Chloroflexota bacterium]
MGIGGGAAKLQIIIDAQNKASDELKELQNELKNTAKVAPKASKGVTSFSGSLKSLAVNAGIVVGGLAAVGVVAKKAFEFAAEGALAQRIENTFTTISGGAEMAASNLETLRSATRGAVSDTELMEGATNVLALGLASTSEEMANITRNVAALGQKFGGTMQVFQLMMSNKSLARVDSFGLGVKEVTDKIKEFTDAGMDADKAFDTAVLESMNEKFEELGGSADDGALAIERMAASALNLSDVLKKAAAPAASNFADVAGSLMTSLADAIKLQNEFNESGKFGGFTWVAYGDAVGGFVKEQDAANDQTETMTARMADAQQQVRMMAGAQSQLYEQMYRTRTVSEEMVVQQFRVTDAMRDASGAIINSAEAFNQYNDALSATGTDGLERMRDAAAEAKTQFLLAGEALGEMSERQLAFEIIQGFRDAGMAGQELADATDEVLTRFGLLDENERAAQKAIDNIGAAMDRGAINTATMVERIRGIKSALDSLPNFKQIIIEIEERRKFTQEALSESLEDMWTEGMAVGGVSRGGRMMVGERGPEEVILPTGATVNNNQVTNNNYNTTVNTRATSGTYTQDIAWARM